MTSPQRSAIWRVIRDLEREDPARVVARAELGGHSGLGGDVRHRGGAVAVLGEEPPGGDDDQPPPFLGLDDPASTPARRGTVRTSVSGASG
jgi:hypothetical protein